MFEYKPIIHALPLHPDYHFYLLRLDLIHPEFGGNKWFKLKYNLIKAREQNVDTILTFGGAHSNHIAATASACKHLGFKSIGIIRGNEMSNTINKAKENRMKIHFLNSSDYKNKSTEKIINSLKERFGNFYLIPEGGNNSEGINGCKEIIIAQMDYDYIICACGTASTFSGLMLSKKENQIAIGINVLKGENLALEDVKKILIANNFEMHLHGNNECEKTTISESLITDNYALTGYACYDEKLVQIKNYFQKEFNVELDYVYTSKMMLAILDMMNKNKFPKGAKIIAIHSGGLQGNEAFEKRYSKHFGFDTAK